MKRLWISLLIYVLFLSTSYAGDESIAQEYKYKSMIPNRDAVTDVFREVPNSASSDGRYPGFAVEDGWLYVITSDNTWQRVALATWTPAAISGLLEIEGTTSLILIEGSTSSGISLE